MLILSRRPGEDIIIGDNITVTVLGVKRGQIKIGFEAPRDIPIHRKEIKDRIDAEKEAAYEKET